MDQDSRQYDSKLVELFGINESQQKLVGYTKSQPQTTLTLLLCRVNGSPEDVLTLSLSVLSFDLGTPVSSYTRILCLHFHCLRSSFNNWNMFRYEFPCCI